MADGFRIERDSLGEIEVPAEAKYGAQTQRAVENFHISDQRLPSAMIRALGLIKAACASANAWLGQLDDDKAKAIVKQRTGLPADRMLCAATHSHCVPRAVQEGRAEQIVDELLETLKYTAAVTGPAGTSAASSRVCP